MYRLLILSARAAEYRGWIDAACLPGLDVVSTSALSDAIVAGAACDLALADPTLLRAALPHLTRLTWAQSTWAGIEPLLDASLPRGYVLTSACGVFGGLITEYVFGYLIAHERRIIDRYLLQEQGRWDATLPGSLRGKRMGLLGVGSIGAALAHTAKHFGMRVAGYTRESEDCPDVDAYFHGDRRAFAAELDYLVNVMPNTPDTHGLVDATLLQALPPHAVFVNAGRGAAVDDQALVEALQEGRLAGAVLDVFDQEPLPPDHVFWRTPRLLITSHTAGPSIPKDIAGLFAENYRRLLDGQALRCRVDFTRGY